MRLDTRLPCFAAAFARLVESARETLADVDAAVAAIIAAVRAEGDAALARYTERFDRLALAPGAFRFTEAEIVAATAAVPAATLDALSLAAARIEDFHRRQLPTDLAHTDAQGNRMGLRWGPLDAVGLYVPGGKAAYPSSVLMNALPARVAGVPRIAITVPTPDGVVNPLVLAAARLAGVSEVYRIGGAQAVAALAWGTASIAPVDKIVGPGNAYVAAAKRQVYGRVGIDSIAGPSEVVVIADAANDPRWIAADLLAQAEHDEAAQAILITDDAAFAQAAATAVEAELALMPRAAISRASWQRHGAIILARDLAEAAELANALAPEHLELAVAAPETLFARIRHAGAVFLGRNTPEAVGDYVGGPNHVLPTSRSARYASGLSVFDFLKRTSWLDCSPAGLAAIGPAAVTLAEAEGLPGHARSVALRLGNRPPG
ncbi:MAG: histidinol dehydrogenase [Alphaproteobacteria bacterium]|nr:histidinol dehydrogenase [Alphaproteobacteria bacterium]